MTAPDLFVPQQGLIDELTCWRNGNLSTAYARLYSLPHVFSGSDTCASYTEASFPGYVPWFPIPWGGVAINDDGNAELDSNTIVFSLAANSGSYPVYGVFVTDAAKTKLYGVYPFLKPYILSKLQKDLPIILGVVAMSRQ